MIETKPPDIQTEQRVILILSKDPDTAGDWKALFEQRKYRVIWEASAGEGLAASRAISPALILLDLDLPKEELLPLCRDLRAASDGTLLLLNSLHRYPDLLDYHRAGVDEIVSGGLSPMALLVKSLAWLARQEWIVPRRQPTGG